MASYLNIKQQNGQWLVRIDDLDLARVAAGSAAHILHTLEAFGFEWDQLIYQSQRLDHYHDAFAALQAKNALYACRCTRKQLKDRSKDFPLYDRHCRRLRLVPHPDRQDVWRLETPLATDTYSQWHWYDVIQGDQHIHWQVDVDDFIVRRSDGIFAYHLACAVDDVDFGITEVIRGADLLPSTAPQQYIQSLLDKPSPSYGHHPLIMDAQSGIKLSKASKAPALDTAHASAQLVQVLSFLKQNPPAELVSQPIRTVWKWALVHWRIKKIIQDETLQVHQPPRFSRLSE